jgi:hypothetical protein
MLFALILRSEPVRRIVQRLLRALLLALAAELGGRRLRSD